MKKTKDQVNQCVLELHADIGFERMGYMSSQAWHDDPRQTLFTMSRYKFVSKMLDGEENVAEIGCGDGFWSRIVRQTVGKLTITDFDPIFIDDARNRHDEKWNLNYVTYDALSAPMTEKYTAIYSLDVMEHIESQSEDIFLTNITRSLCSEGKFIVGMPSLESQEYASDVSRAGHVNCKTGSVLKELMGKYFKHVFLFSMNDEVVHTGFSPMAHYLIAVCCEVNETYA